jgi:two-component system, NarL family, sensor kinase
MENQMNSRPELVQSTLPREDAEQTLRAIQYGTVDAFVVEGPEGHRVYTLEDSDLPYSTLVERMQQGAAMLDARGCIVYCNPSLAQLLGIPRENVIGRLLQDFIPSTDQPSYQKLLQQSVIGSIEGELPLQLSDGRLIPANFSFIVLSRDKSAIGVLITDLTSQKQQMEFTSRLQSVQDEERRRIARELHDSVGQLLAAIGMNVNVVQAGNLDSTAAQALADNAALLEQASSEIRTISYLLHPPLLDDVGLASTLDWYVEGFSQRSKIKVSLEIPVDLGRLSSEMEIAIFRIIQECLTNIHRHSGSATAVIRIKESDGGLVVQVQDSGKGIPQEKLELIGSGRGGVGFGGMQERLRHLGGTLEVISNPTGTLVSAVFKAA